MKAWSLKSSQGEGKEKKKKKTHKLSRGCNTAYKDTEDWYVGKMMNFSMRLKERELQVGTEGDEV